MGGTCSWLGGRRCWLGGLGRLGGSNPDTIATLVLAQARVVLPQAGLYCQLSSEGLVHCHRLAPASQAGACHGAIGQRGGMGGGGGMGGTCSWLGGRRCWLGGLGRLGGSNPDTIATLVLAQAQVVLPQARLYCQLSSEGLVHCHRL